MNDLLKLLNSSQHTIALTGAGISTLSGIKDFRGKNGINKTMPGEKIFDIEQFYRDPSFYYEHTRDFIYNLDDKEPNIVHSTLARWEAQGKLKSVITQNIDLLHQKAGSKNVIEIHGSPVLHHCINCYKEYSYEEVCEQLMIKIKIEGEVRDKVACQSKLEHRLELGSIPRCELCGGVLKPDITFYGEGLPEHAINEAVRECQRCDLMMVLGTSLVVYPAAQLPQIAHENEAKIVIVNEQGTRLDDVAILKFNDLYSVFN